MGSIALNKKDEYGAFCVQGGFNYAVKMLEEEKLLDADYYLKSWF